MDSNQLRRCLASDPKMRHFIGSVSLGWTSLNTPTLGQAAVCGEHSTLLPSRIPLADCLLSPWRSSTCGILWCLDYPTHYGTLVESLLGTMVQNMCIKLRHFSLRRLWLVIPCLYYLSHRIRGLGMNTILKDFSPVELYVNEYKVVDFVQKHFTYWVVIWSRKSFLNNCFIIIILIIWLIRVETSRNKYYVVITWFIE